MAELGSHEHTKQLLATMERDFRERFATIERHCRKALATAEKLDSLAMEPICVELRGLLKQIPRVPEASAAERATHVEQMKAHARAFATCRGVSSEVVVRLHGSEHPMCADDAEHLVNHLMWAIGVSNALSYGARDPDLVGTDPTPLHVALEYLRRSARASRVSSFLDTPLEQVVAAARATGATSEQILAALQDSKTDS